MMNGDFAERNHCQTFLNMMENRYTGNACCCWWWSSV